MTRAELRPGWVWVTLVQGVEGPSLYINDTRVVGNKPWGGGTVIWERAVLIDRIRNAMPKPIELLQEMAEYHRGEAS